MNTEYLNKNLLSEIKKRIPQKSKRSNFLAEILFIEKEAVYRRLRGEVPFTLREVVIISQKLNISVDNLINTDAKKNKLSHVLLTEHVEPFETDYKEFEGYIETLKSGNEKGSEMVEASNTLPQSIFLKSDLITRYYYFKWNFHYNQSYDTFTNFHLPRRLKVLQNQHSIESKKFDHTTFIWDPLIIQYLINDLRYLFKIQLVNEKEIISLKQELHILINYLENIAQNGVFPETSHKVDIYIYYQF